MKITTRRRSTLLVALLALVVGSFVTPPAQAVGPELRPARLDVTGWTHLAGPAALPGPSEGNGIGPGSYLIIQRTDGTFICTANFVWNGPGGAKYLGAAGHCFLPDNVAAAPASDPGHYVHRVQVCVSGCAFGGQLGSVIRGTLVQLGPVVHARQSAGGLDIGNDFGLVTIPVGEQGRIRTKLPVWGGPTGVQAAPGLGTSVCVYGNATGFGEVFATKARSGVAGLPNQTGTAWYATLPSAPGDSGSAVVRCPGLTGGTAVGILTHLGTNGTGIIAGTTVERAIQMVQADVNKTISVAL